MPDATTRAGILAREGVISYYFDRNVILAFLSSHFARCNNQGRHFGKRNVKKLFLSLKYKPSALLYFCAGP
jgi:hypothetical protein